MVKADNTMPAELSRAPQVRNNVWCHLVTTWPSEECWSSPSLQRGCWGAAHGVRDSSFPSVAGDQLGINKERIALPVYSFLSRRQAVILKGANDTMAKTI